MTYASATITGSATGPADLRTVIEGLMTSQGNWEFVEAYTATTFNVRVWRNKAAGNSWGTAWYLAMITNTAAATSLIFKVFEDYATGTKLGYRGVAGSTVLDVASGSSYGNTGYAPENTNWVANLVLACPSSSFTYRVRVTASAVIAQSSSTSNPLYIGLFNPLWAHANEFPLVSCYLGAAGGSNGALTRRPGLTASGSGLFGLNTSASYDKLAGKIGLADGMCGSRVYGGRYYLDQYYAPTGNTESTRGYLDTDLLWFQTDAAVAVGDTFTVNGNPYIEIFDNGATGIFLRTD